jgi:hypothetical protein
MTEAKAFRTFNRIYSLFKSERLSANIKRILHKALIRAVTTRLEICGRYSTSEIAAFANEVSPWHW